MAHPQGYPDRTLLYDDGFDNVCYATLPSADVFFDEHWDERSKAVLAALRERAFQEALDAVASHIDVDIVLFQIRESLGLSTEGYTNHRVLEEERPLTTEELYPPSREHPKR